MVCWKCSETQPVISWVGAPGVNTFATPSLLELRDVRLGHDAAAEDRDVGGVALGEQVVSIRKRVMCAPESTDRSDRVGVLLDGGLDDLLGCLVQAGVDDLVAGIAEGTRDDLRAPVVAVQPGLPTTMRIMAAGYRSV